MNIQVFSLANINRCESKHGFNHPLHSWSTSDWFMAVLGELGEAANVAKKIKRIQQDIRGNKPGETLEKLQAKLELELGDALIYLDLLCQSLGLDMGEVMVKAFNHKSAEIGWKLLDVQE